jgi:transcriptional regulator with XRE-family HTH domain
MTITVAKEIGKVIKSAREKQSLTQQDLSERVGISRNYISDIECGRYIPSVEKLLSLATTLEIDLNLFKNDGNARSE